MFVPLSKITASVTKTTDAIATLSNFKIYGWLKRIWSLHKESTTAVVQLILKICYLHLHGSVVIQRGQGMTKNTKSILLSY